MDSTSRLRGAIVALLLASTGCGGAETGVQRVDLGPTTEARNANCDVTAWAHAPPLPGTRPLAQLRVHCRTQNSDESTRLVCQETLRRAACEVGADAAWSYRFTREVGGLRLEAKVGLKPRGFEARTECMPTCSPGRACVAGYCVEVCEPTCEAGFVCEAGSCEPMCRPRCAEGETCSTERRCMAAEADAPSADGGAADGSVDGSVDSTGDQAAAAADGSAESTGEQAAAGGADVPGGSAEPSGADAGVAAAAADAGGSAT